MKISKDFPLSEITLRKYEKPSENIPKRELIRKLCLSIGLLQPGDSRDVIVDIIYVFLQAKKQKKELNCDEVRAKVITYRKKCKLPLLGVAASNIRRQIRRAKELFIVEKRVTRYRITEFYSLEEIYKEKIEGLVLNSITTRIREYLENIDKGF